MRFIFDLLKDVLRWVDGLWIESAGHPIVVKGVFTPKEQKDALYREDRGGFCPLGAPVIIYGFYNYPTINKNSIYGIDSPDQIEVQVNPEIVCAKLVGTPKIGTVVVIEGCTWIVINRGYIYNRFIGQYRLSLNCQRYQESVIKIEEEEVTTPVS